MIRRMRAAAKAFLNPQAARRAGASPPPAGSPPFPRADAEPCALVNAVVSRFDRIPGFFNVDDCMHFYLILEMQALLGVTGDLLEIGPYFGRSTSLLVFCLKRDEKILVCDAFDAEIEDAYASTPTIDDLKRNTGLVNPDFDFDRLEIHSCLSKDLRIPAARRFRFAHVDGGHDAETAYHDISLAASRLLPRGIIAIDDYKHPDWPGVTEGTDRFLQERGSEFRVLADMNRHVAKGRKLYLTRVG